MSDRAAQLSRTFTIAGGASHYQDTGDEDNDDEIMGEKILTTTRRTTEDKKLIEVETSKFEGLECLSSFATGQGDLKDSNSEDALEKPYFYQQDCDALRKELFPDQNKGNYQDREDTTFQPLHFKVRLPNPNQVTVVKDFPKLQTIHEPHSEKRAYWFGSIKMGNDPPFLLVLYWTNLYFHSPQSTFPVPIDQIQYVLHDRFDQKKVMFLRRITEDLGEEKEVLVEFHDIDAKVEFLNYFSDAYWSITGAFPEIFFVDDIASFKGKKFDPKTDAKATEDVLYIDEKRDKVGIASKPKIFTELLEFGDSEILFTDAFQVEYLISQTGKGGREIKNPMFIASDFVMTDKAIYIYPKEPKAAPRRISYEDIERVCTQKDMNYWSMVFKVPPDYDLFVTIPEESGEAICKILTSNIYQGMDIQDYESDVKNACQYFLEEEERFTSFKPILTELLKIKKTTPINEIIKTLRKVPKLDDAQRSELMSKREGGAEAITQAKSLIKNERKKQIDAELYNEAIKNRDIRTILLIYLKDYNKFVYRENRTGFGVNDDTIPKEAQRLFNEECLLKKIRDSITQFAFAERTDKKDKERITEQDIKRLLDDAIAWGLTTQADQLSLVLNEEIQKTKMVNHIEDALATNNFEKLTLSINSASLLKNIELDPTANKIYKNACIVYPVYKSIYDISKQVTELQASIREPVQSVCKTCVTLDELNKKLNTVFLTLSIKNQHAVDNLKTLIQVLDKRINDLSDVIERTKAADKLKDKDLEDLMDMFGDGKKKKSGTVVVTTAQDILSKTLSHPEIFKMKQLVKDELERQSNDMAAYMKQAILEWEQLQSNIKNQDEYEKILDEAILSFNDEEITRILSLGYEPKSLDKKKKAMDVLEICKEFNQFLLMTALATRQIKSRTCSQRLLIKIYERQKFMVSILGKKYDLKLEPIMETIERVFKKEIDKIQTKIEVEERLFNALLTLDPLNIKNAMIALMSPELYDSSLRNSITRAEKIITSNEAKINFITENLNDAINTRDREKLAKLIKIAVRFKSLKSQVESAKRILFDDQSRVKEAIDEMIVNKDSDALDEFLEENEAFIPIDDFLEFQAQLKKFRNGREYKLTILKEKLNSAISKRDKFQLAEAVQFVNDRIIAPPEKSKIKKKNEIYALLEDAKKILTTMNETFITELTSNLENILDDSESLLFTTEDPDSIMDLIDNRNKKKHPALERLELEFKDLDKAPTLEKCQKLTRVVSKVFFDKLKPHFFWHVVESHPSDVIHSYVVQFKQLWPQLQEPLTLSYVFLFFCLQKGLLLNLLKEIIGNDMQPYYEIVSCIRNVKHRDNLYVTFGKFSNYKFDVSGELWLAHPVARIKMTVKRIIEEFKISKKERDEKWQQKMERIVYWDLGSELECLLSFGTRKEWHLWDMIEEVAASRRKTSVDFGGILLPQLMDETNAKLTDKSLKFAYFIGLALQKKGLSDVLQSVLNPETLKYYNKTSLVYDSKVIKKTVTYLSVLNKIDVTLNFKMNYKY